MKRKGFKLFILLISLFIGISNANASLSVGENVTLNAVYGKNDNGYLIHRGYYDDFTYGKNNSSHEDNAKYSAIVYETIKSSDKYITYCLDPNVNWTGNSVYVTEVIEKKENDTPFREYEKVGIKAILKNGYNNYNTVVPVEELSSEDFYFATGLAIRTFVSGVAIEGVGGTQDKSGMTEAVARQGAEWFLSLKKSAPDVFNTAIAMNWMYYNVYKFDNNSTAESWNSAVNSVLKEYAGPQGFYFHVGAEAGQSDRGTKVFNLAHDLFNKGVEAVADYIKNGGKDASTEGTASVEASKMTVTDEYIMFSLTIKDFDESGHIYVSNPICNDCVKNGVTIGAGEYGSGTNWTTLTTSTDVTDYASKNNGVVWVRYAINKEYVDKCSSSNVKINYTVDYGVNNDIEKWVAYLLEKNKPTKDGISSSGGMTQRYVTILKEGSDINGDGSVNGTIACQNKKKVCETKIDSPICSSNKDDAVATITAPTDIKNCIIDNVDDAGNTYKLETQDILNNNPYCSVFCKEDYPEIRYNPIVQNLNCGGYFKLTVNIKGKKSCYVAGKSNQFAMLDGTLGQNLAAIQESLADALTKYSLYSAWAKSSAPSSPTTTTPLNCGGTCSQSTYSYTISVNYNIYTASTGHRISSTPASTSLTFATSCSCGTTHCPSSCDASTKASTIFDEKSYTIGNYNSLKTYAKSMADNYYKSATEYQNQFETNIVQYNSCTTGWTNEFDFSQKLKYEYDQEYYTNLREDQKYLLPEDDLKTEERISVCKSETTNEYECKDGWTDITVEHDLEEYAYSADYQDFFENRSMTICHAGNGEGNCTQVSVPISTATFIRRTVEKEQSYKTPNIAYQINNTGYITTDGDKYTGSDVNLGLIPSGLPISNRTVYGGITKISLYGLGEFYGGTNAGTNGRLVDFDNNDKLESDTVAYALGENWNSNVGVGEAGEYYCEFLTKCRPKDCPTCKWECVPGPNPDDPTHCEWQECPACKVTCINCMFNLDELQLNFKSISPNNFGSAERKLGYNWVIDTSLPALALLSQKASVTMSEIMANNETIYDSEGKDNNGNPNLAFSIRMTPEVTNFIKGFNSDIESNNGKFTFEGVQKSYGTGYANNTLMCYNDEEKGYNNIYCYSDFIDMLVKKFPSDINGLTNRTPVAERKDSPNKYSYWTLWDDDTPGVQNGYSEQQCSIDEPNCHNDTIGGPAWK